MTQNYLKSHKLRVIIGVVAGISVVVIILLFAILNLDKGKANFSLSIDESVSNQVFVESYSIICQDNFSCEVKKNMNLESIFVENNWDLEYSFPALNKVLRKIAGYNIVLPIEVNELSDLDENRFYLINGSDTLRLIGNRTIKTSFYNKVSRKDLNNYELIIANPKKEKSYTFKLE